MHICRNCNFEFDEEINICPRCQAIMPIFDLDLRPEEFENKIAFHKAKVRRKTYFIFASIMIIVILIVTLLMYLHGYKIIKLPQWSFEIIPFTFIVPVLFIIPLKIYLELKEITYHNSKVEGKIVDYYFRRMRYKARDIINKYYAYPIAEYEVNGKTYRCRSNFNTRATRNGNIIGPDTIGKTVEVYYDDSDPSDGTFKFLKEERYLIYFKTVLPQILICMLSIAVAMILFLLITM